MTESKFFFTVGFYLTYFKKSAKNKTKMATELTCSVCGGVVEEAHKCILCKKNVHMFCGKGNEDEEGFEQNVFCFVCLKKNGI